MTVLDLLVYGSYLLYGSFIFLCLACGLYYIAEFVEEYVTFSKKILTRALQVVIIIHILFLLFDNLPTFYLLIGLIAHLIYYQLLSKYPFLQLSDPIFILAAIFAIVDHCGWFYYFSTHYYPFSQLLAYFTVCVWLIPFGFFISLSANENVLPGSLGFSGETENEDQTARKQKSFNVFVSFFSFVKQKLGGITPKSLTGPSNFDKML